MVAPMETLILEAPATPGPGSASAPASVRERLLALVRDAPGLNKSRLQAYLGVAWGTVAYHVRILVAAGLIEAEPHGRDVVLFPRGLPDPPRRQARALRMPEASRVLEALAQARESYLVEVSQRSGLSRKVVRRRLAELMRAGLVQDRGLRRARYALVAVGGAGGNDDTPDAGAERHRWHLDLKGPLHGSAPWQQR